MELVKEDINYKGVFKGDINNKGEEYKMGLVCYT